MNEKGDTIYGTYKKTIWCVGGFSYHQWVTHSASDEEKTGHSLGTVNRVLKDLTEAGYVADGAITNDGVNAMEPYCAKRAIFIAAGFGTRLVPITFNTSKPLVRVHGVRIIDRLIDACLEAGINEIYIVRGYLGELFDQLFYKYPMI